MELLEASGRFGPNGTQTRGPDLKLSGNLRAALVATTPHRNKNEEKGMNSLRWGKGGSMGRNPSFHPGTDTQLREGRGGASKGVRAFIEERRVP